MRISFDFRPLALRRRAGLISVATADAQATIDAEDEAAWGLANLREEGAGTSDNLVPGVPLDDLAAIDLEVDRFQRVNTGKMLVDLS